MVAWAAPQVVAMRLAKLSRGGPAAAVEAERTVLEKMAAGTEIAHAAGRAAWSGDLSGLGEAALHAVHGRVVKNHRRLSAELRRTASGRTRT
jgi:hypothetical protein